MYRQAQIIIVAVVKHTLLLGTKDGIAEVSLCLAFSTYIRIFLDFFLFWDLVYIKITMPIFEMCKSGEIKIILKTQSTNLGEYRPAWVMSFVFCA